MTETHPRRLVKISQAADYLMVNPATVRRWIARGDISAYRLGSQFLRIDLDELDQRLRKPAGDHR